MSVDHFLPYALHQFTIEVPSALASNQATLPSTDEQATVHIKKSSGYDGSLVSIHRRRLHGDYHKTMAQGSVSSMAKYKYEYRCPRCGTQLVLKMRTTLTKRRCPHCGLPITPDEIDRQARVRWYWQLIKRMFQQSGCLAIVAVTTLCSLLLLAAR